MSITSAAFCLKIPQVLALSGRIVPGVNETFVDALFRQNLLSLAFTPSFPRNSALTLALTQTGGVEQQLPLVRLDDAHELDEVGIAL